MSLNVLESGQVHKAEGWWFFYDGIVLEGIATAFPESYKGFLNLVEDAIHAWVCLQATFTLKIVEMHVSGLSKAQNYYKATKYTESQ